MNPALIDENIRISDMLKWEFGPVLCALFEDSKVIEIMLNPDGEIWVERLGQPMQQCGRLDK